MDSAMKCPNGTNMIPAYRLVPVIKEVLGVFFGGRVEVTLSFWPFLN
jgi:hypothetical protein